MGWAITGENDQTPAGTLDVYLTDTSTGLSAVLRTDWLADWATEQAAFYIGEGNFACDCNRAIWFAEAIGQAEPDDSLPCGDGRFQVYQVMRLSDGAVIYRDETSG